LFQPQRGIIVELKTLYAFPSAVFHLVADSRKGVVGQVDVRDFWKPGGHHPIDAWLIERTVNILSLALMFRAEYPSGGAYKCLEVKTRGAYQLIDCVLGSIQVNNTTPELANPLGPLQKNALESCHSTILYTFRDQVYQKQSDDLHCNFCTKYNQNL
jgi:hypothetical protein